MFGFKGEKNDGAVSKIRIYGNDGEHCHFSGVGRKAVFQKVFKSYCMSAVGCGIAEIVMSCQDRRIIDI